jgi:hypothetical protein
VVGLFPYGPQAGIGSDGQNEIDIEYARWGNASYPNGNYTVYPATGTGSGDTTFEFTLTGTYTTSRFTWSSTKIDFVTMSGFAPVDSTTGLIKAWTFAPATPATKVPQQALPLGMNLWCFQCPPSDGQNVEIVVRDFTFVPLGAAIDAGMGDSGAGGNTGGVGGTNGSGGSAGKGGAGGTDAAAGSGGTAGAAGSGGANGSGGMSGSGGRVGSGGAAGGGGSAALGGAAGAGTKASSGGTAGNPMGGATGITGSGGTAGASGSGGNGGTPGSGGLVSTGGAVGVGGSGGSGGTMSNGGSAGASAAQPAARSSGGCSCSTAAERGAIKGPIWIVLAGMLFVVRRFGKRRRPAQK